jgi:hypothetical protein
LVVKALPHVQQLEVRRFCSIDTIHSLCAADFSARRPDEQLYAMILADFLGLDFSRECQELRDTKDLFRLLSGYAGKAPEVFAADLGRMVEGDRERPRPGEPTLTWFYRDLLPYQKTALLLSLVNAGQDSRWRAYWSHEIIALLEGGDLAPRLRLVTKLRVVREFLEIDLERKFHPDPEQEFARLTAALNVIHNDDPALYYERLMQTWPKSRDSG